MTSTSTSTGIKVARLSHVGLRANDLSKQAEFYTARWGLEPIDEGGQSMFLRADGPDHHVLTLHAGAEPAGLDHFAFEVEHPDDIERAADMLPPSATRSSRHRPRNWSQVSHAPFASRTPTATSSSLSRAWTRCGMTTVHATSSPRC